MGIHRYCAAFLWLAGLLLAPSTSSALSPAIPSTPLVCQPGTPTPDDLSPKGVLFRLQAPNGQTNFLFGTLHFGSSEELGIDTGKIQDLLQSARLLVSEVNDAEDSEPALHQEQLLGDGITLPSLIGARAFVELSHRLPEIAPQQLTYFRPWLALALLEARGEPASPRTLDRRIQQWARDQGLTSQALETTREQLIALNCVPSWDQAVVLRQRLRNPDLFTEQAERVLGWYRQRNLPAWLAEIDAMRGLDEQGAQVERRSRRCLLDERNERWLAELEPTLAAGNAFVAVGALHLVGDGGLLMGLCRRGYLVSTEPY